MSKLGHRFTNDRPTDFGCPQRPSSGIQRSDRSQLPATTIQLHSMTRPTSAYPHQTSSCISTTRPTPATLVQRPTAHDHDSTIPAIDITHPSWRPHTTATDIYIHVCNSGNKNVTFVVSVISPFRFLHCLWLTLHTHTYYPKIINKHFTSLKVHKKLLRLARNT